MTKPSKTVPEKWKLTSLDTTWYEGWYIKASLSSFNTFLVVMINEKTDDCHTGFFTDEEQCNSFISNVIEKA